MKMIKSLLLLIIFSISLSRASVYKTFNVSTLSVTSCSINPATLSIDTAAPACDTVLKITNTTNESVFNLNVLTSGTFVPNQFTCKENASTQVGTTPYKVYCIEQPGQSEDSSIASTLLSNISLVVIALLLILSL